MEKPAEGQCRLARLAALLLALCAAAGCAARSYDQINATREYHHHLSGTEVVTHAEYL